MGQSSTKCGVVVWGSPEFGQLGVSASSADDKAHHPRLVEALRSVPVKAVASGGHHSAVLTDNGEVYTWGQGRHGQLGHGALKDVGIPKSIRTLHGKVIKQVACAEQHSAAVSESGVLFTWGSGQNGRLGHGNEQRQLVPVVVKHLVQHQVLQVSCGEFHTGCLAVSRTPPPLPPLSGGGTGPQSSAGGRAPGSILNKRVEVFTWGLGLDGRLGHGDEGDRWVPSAVEGLGAFSVEQVACGGHHSAAIVEGGALFTWGGGAFGKLGHGNRQAQLAPRRVARLAGQKVTGVALGCHHSACVTARGEVFSWGQAGRLGHVSRGAEVDEVTPRPVAAMRSLFASSVSCGYAHTTVLLENGQVYAWGATRAVGHTDQGVQANHPACVRALSGKAIVEVACGHSHTLALSDFRGLATRAAGAVRSLGASATAAATAVPTAGGNAGGMVQTGGAREVPVGGKAGAAASAAPPTPVAAQRALAGSVSASVPGSGGEKDLMGVEGGAGGSGVSVPSLVEKGGVGVGEGNRVEGEEGVVGAVEGEEEKGGKGSVLKGKSLRDPRKKEKLVGSGGGGMLQALGGGAGFPFGFALSEQVVSQLEGDLGHALSVWDSLGLSATDLSVALQALAHAAAAGKVRDGSFSSPDLLEGAVLKEKTSAAMNGKEKGKGEGDAVVPWPLAEHVVFLSQELQTSQQETLRLSAALRNAQAKIDILRTENDYLRTEGETLRELHWHSEGAPLVAEVQDAFRKAFTESVLRLQRRHAHRERKMIAALLHIRNAPSRSLPAVKPHRPATTSAEEEGNRKTRTNNRVSGHPEETNEKKEGAGSRNHEEERSRRREEAVVHTRGSDLCAPPSSNGYLGSGSQEPQNAVRVRGAGSPPSQAPAVSPQAAAAAAGGSGSGSLVEGARRHIGAAAEFDSLLPGFSQQENKRGEGEEDAGVPESLQTGPVRASAPPREEEIHGRSLRLPPEGSGLSNGHGGGGLMGEAPNGRDAVQHTWAAAEGGNFGERLVEDGVGDLGMPAGVSEGVAPVGWVDHSDVLGLGDLTDDVEDIDGGVGDGSAARPLDLDLESFFATASAAPHATIDASPGGDRLVGGHGWDSLHGLEGGDGTIEEGSSSLQGGFVQQRGTGGDKVEDTQLR